jgi:O-antigen ligase
VTRLKQYGFYCLFFSLPLVALLKGKGIVLSLILFLLLVDGLKHLYVHIKSIKPNLKLPFYIMIAASVIALLIKNRTGLFGVGRLLAIIICSYYAIYGAVNSKPSDCIFIKKTFLRGMCLYTVFLFMECYSGLASYLYLDTPHFNSGLFIRGTVILTFLSVPFWWALRQDRHTKIYHWIFIVCLGLILLKAQPSAARLAVLFSIFCGGIAHTKHGLKLLFSALSLWLITAPFIFTHLITRAHLFSVLHYLPSSYQHRVQIWQIFAKKALNRPWFGHGFQARLRSEELTDKICLNYKINAKVPKITQLSHDIYDWGKAICFDEAVITTHPHNAALQIWFEGGVFGVILALCFLWLLYKVLASQSQESRIVYMAIIGLSIVYWNVSFGLWQTWVIASVALTIGLIQTIKGPQKGKKTHV